MFRFECWVIRQHKKGFSQEAVNTDFLQVTYRYWTKLKIFLLNLKDTVFEIFHGNVKNRVLFTLD